MAPANPALHIISVIDDEIDETEKFSTVVKPAEEERIVTMDSEMVYLLNSMERLEKFLRFDAPSPIVNQERKLVAAYRRAAERSMGKEIVDLILNSKSHVHVLMDSVGGNKVAGNPYFSLMERAADTSAYVTREASSLACNLLLDTDNGYCLNDSFILWHLGRHDEDDFGGRPKGPVDPENDLFQMEEDEETWDNFTAMMNGKCGEDKRDEMNAKLAASRGAERREVVFSGRELADLGIIREAFDTTRGLMEKFFEKTGITADLAGKSTAIRQFFILARWSEMISKRAGFNCSCVIDSSGRLIPRIVNDEDYTPENERLVKGVVDALLARAARLAR